VGGGAEGSGNAGSISDSTAANAAYFSADAARHEVLGYPRTDTLRGSSALSASASPTSAPVTSPSAASVTSPSAASVTSTSAASVTSPSPASVTSPSAASVTSLSAASPSATPVSSAAYGAGAGTGSSVTSSPTVAAVASQDTSGSEAVAPSPSGQDEDTQFKGKCRIVQKDIDYIAEGPGTGDYALNHIPDPGMCCAMCQGIKDCVAWVWRDEKLEGCPYKCWILTTAPKQGTPTEGVISGMPPVRPSVRVPDSTKATLEAPPDNGSYLRVEDAGSSFSSSSGGASDLAKCADYGENCWGQRCCKKASQRCYMKNAQWAGCRESCQAGVNPEDPEEARTPWSCQDVSQDSSGAPLPPSHAPFMAIEPVIPPGETIEVPPPEEPYTPLPALAVEATQVGSGQGPGLQGLSMFCFSLCQPTGYEPKLLKVQQHLGTSIFACEAWAVYSNRAFEIAPGVTTSVVANSLKCEVHEIAWNTNIFIAVWHKVINQSWYRSYDWTVKVDPDAVFFATRLRVVLQDHTTAGYLGNCQYGLHGPIEVFSRSAIDTLAQDYQASPDGTRPQNCIERYPQAIAGKAQWGEDLFLDFCLRNVLGVRAALDTRLMCEAHCDCPDWYWCHNGTSRVTYHPFKQADMYTQCVANAMAGAPDP